MTPCTLRRGMEAGPCLIMHKTSGEYEDGVCKKKKSLPHIKSKRLLQEWGFVSPDGAAV